MDKKRGLEFKLVLVYWDLGIWCTRGMVILKYISQIETNIEEKVQEIVDINWKIIYFDFDFNLILYLKIVE